MVSPYMNVEAQQSELKVSILARLLASAAYLIPAIGSALGALYLIDIMRILKTQESVGLRAVVGALTESIVPALGGLYLGILGGGIVVIVLIVRMFMQTKTASPSGWLIFLCGMLFLVPAGLFFEAESMIIEVLIAPVMSSGMADIASTVNLLAILSVASSLFILILLIVLAVLPLSAGSKPRWSPLIAAVLVEILLIAAAVAFQLRFLWLYNSVDYYG